MTPPPPTYSPDGLFWWDGHRWLPTPTRAPQLRTPISLRWLHWLIPLAFVIVGFFLVGQANDAKVFGIATDQSIGDAAAAFACFGLAAGYCFGRWVAWMQRRRPAS